MCDTCLGLHSLIAANGGTPVRIREIFVRILGSSCCIFVFGGCCWILEIPGTQMTIVLVGKDLVLGG